MQIHKMIEKNLPKKTGVCRSCGVVTLLKASNGSYVCRNSPAVTKMSPTQRKLKISPEEFWNLRDKVDGTKECAICGYVFYKKKDLFIDHSHTTGMIRGILCSSCNLGLGHFKDNELFLKKAILYLKKTA